MFSTQFPFTDFKLRLKLGHVEILSVREEKEQVQQVAETEINALRLQVTICSHDCSFRFSIFHLKKPNLA